MKKLRIAFTTIVLAFGCFLLSPAVQADDGHGIVGLWRVTYYLPGNVELFTLRSMAQ
jgi:hypothetical protein